MCILLTFKQNISTFTRNEINNVSNSKGNNFKVTSNKIISSFLKCED